MSMYDVHICIPTKLLTPLLELIEGEGGVVVRLVEQSGRIEPKRKKQRNGNNGFSRNQSVALETLTQAGRALSRKEIVAAFERHGIPEGSVSGVLFSLRDQKKLVHQLSDGRWELTPQ